MARHDRPEVSMKDSPFLTFEEAAEFLRMSEGRLRQCVKARTIPHEVWGRAPVFHRGLLEEWAKKRMLENVAL